jgi:hypothetical protein
MADQVLSRTLNQKFDTVFKEVTHHEALGLLNRNDLKLFCLDIESNQFDYGPLVEFLEDNLGHYVFSRAELDDLILAGKDQSVALKAVRRLGKTGKPGEKGTGNELGEILDYCFFEHVLGAPKILSKIEQVTAGGTYKAQSEGVHLLSVGDKDTPAYQLVYGASGIIDDIQDAIDKAFEEVAAVSGGQRKERQVVDGTIMGKSFDDHTTARLKEILLPSKTKIPVDNAYGMFIGYTIGLDPDQYTNDEYRKAVQDKMLLDIQHHVQYIVDKINKLRLSRCSFYIYILPLNQAVVDQKEIMDRLLGGDD